MRLYLFPTLISWFVHFCLSAFPAKNQQITTQLANFRFIVWVLQISCCHRWLWVTARPMLLGLAGGIMLPAPANCAPQSCEDPASDWCFFFCCQCSVAIIVLYGNNCSRALQLWHMTSGKYRGPGVCRQPFHLFPLPWYTPHLCWSTKQGLRVTWGWSQTNKPSLSLMVNPRSLSPVSDPRDQSEHLFI